MDQEKLRVTSEVLDDLSTKYPETAQYTKENMKEVCEREKSSVEEVLYFVFVVVVVVV